MLKVYCLEYDQKGSSGSGGWSRNAKHKPQPRVVSGEVPDMGQPVAGKRRRKFTAFDLGTTPPTIIRRDYALEELRKLGAELPALYADELGTIRDGQDRVVMRGPHDFEFTPERRRKVCKPPPFF